MKIKVLVVFAAAVLFLAVARAFPSHQAGQPPHLYFYCVPKASCRGASNSPGCDGDHSFNKREEPSSDGPYPVEAAGSTYSAPAYLPHCFAYILTAPCLSCGIRQQVGVVYVGQCRGRLTPTPRSPVANCFDAGVEKRRWFDRAMWRR